MSDQQCFFSFPTLTWYPGKVSTFIFPVIEIEQIIAELTSLRDNIVKLSQYPTSAPTTTKPVTKPTKSSVVSSLLLNDYEKVNATITN